eukprot:PhF_6_TR33714/c1_g1_i3/m.49482
MLFVVTSIFLIVTTNLATIHAAGLPSTCVVYNQPSAFNPTHFRGYEDRLSWKSYTPAPNTTTTATTILRSPQCWTSSCGTSTTCADKTFSFVDVAETQTTPNTVVPPTVTPTQPYRAPVVMSPPSPNEAEVMCNLKMCDKNQNSFVVPGVGLDGSSSLRVKGTVVSAADMILTPPSSEDTILVNSFVAQTREQFFASMPVRFGASTPIVASNVAGQMQQVGAVLRGNYWLLSDITVVLGTWQIRQGFVTTSEFSQALSMLPVAYSAATKSIFQKFIALFGTHVVTSVQLGARATASVLIPRCNTDLVAQDVITKYSNDLVQIAIGQSTNTTLITETFGGPPSYVLHGTNGFSSWRSNVRADNAVRIQIEVKEIYDPTFVGDVLKQNALREAVLDLTRNRTLEYSAAEDGLGTTSSKVELNGCEAKPYDPRPTPPGVVVGVVIACVIAFAILIGGARYWSVHVQRDDDNDNDDADNRRPGNNNKNQSHSQNGHHNGHPMVTVNPITKTRFNRHGSPPGASDSPKHPDVFF